MLLQQYGFSAIEAFKLSRNWAREDEKEAVMQRLKKHGVPNAYIKMLKTADNIWNTASCLSRIRWLVMLKYYEMNYPREYQQIVPKE